MTPSGEPSPDRVAVSVSRVVVTGTGTEIGKTLVAAGVARALSDAGFDVRAIKPVESGISEMEPDEEDGAILARAARQAEPPRAFVRLSAALAPPAAADLEGVELDLDDLVRWIEESAADAEVALVEAAGGVLSPLTWSASGRDLARTLGAHALLVAPDRLGVLTHTLTALEALEGAGVPLLGVVYSAPAEADASTGRNVEALRRYASVERVLRLPRVSGVEEAAERLVEVVEWIEDGWE